MPLLSQYARKQKLSYFTRELPKNARILEVGCGDGWFGLQLKSAGYKNYVGLDLKEQADIEDKILGWKRLGLHPESFDAIIASELVEHEDCFQDAIDIFKQVGPM